jgi:hypothetical protein
VRQAGDGRRQRLGDGDIGVRDRARFEFGQHLEDARAALGGVVEVDVEVRDAPDAQPRTQLVTDERHRVSKGLQRGVALGRLADDADPDLGVPQVVGRLDARDRREPDPRIRDLATDDRADLLAEEFVDAFGSLAHVSTTNELPRRPRGRPCEGATEHHGERTSRCVSEGAEGATHAGAFMRVAFS